jgi:hypothetical protein
VLVRAAKSSLSAILFSCEFLTVQARAHWHIIGFQQLVPELGSGQGSTMSRTPSGGDAVD